jgi:F-type H+-transporting ATPase subunit epsilon
MADSVKFELISPQKLLVSAHVREIIVPGSEGDFTVLPHHAPFLASLRPGILRIPGMEGGLDEVYVRGGIADVTPGGLTVLVEQAIPLNELRAERLDQEITDAENALAEAQNDDTKRQATDTLERLNSLRDALKLAA